MAAPADIAAQADIVVTATRSTTPTGLDAKVVELADVLAGRAAARQADEDIVIYKSVGVGLEDVALAGYAYRRLAAQRGWPAP
ncbi:ornithine cyclodeaminase [Bordetella pertussis]|nr:ornithine cyclodeaminase [Bordetella pertussis]